MPSVDDFRNRIQRINERRDQLVSHMERMEYTNKQHHDILDDLEQSVKFLRELNRDGVPCTAVTQHPPDEVMEE